MSNLGAFEAVNLPINISPVLPQAGAQTAAGGPTALPAGIDGLFARLLDLLGGGASASGQQGDETTPQQTGSTFFNVQLGDLTAGLEAGEEGLTLTGVADMLGLEIEVDVDPEQAIAGIAGPLVDLLNSLAARIDTAAEVSTEQANAALQLARGLIQSGGNTAEINLDLALQTTGRDTPQQGLAAQLRAAAADLELVRQDIPIPTARAQATAILSGNAPTLDELLNPRVNANANGSGNGGEGSRDGTRLANTLGASLNARAGAAVNQPAPTANGAQTLANALADAGIKANVTTQQVQPDPLPNPQVTHSGAPTLSSDVSAAARPLQAAYQPPQVNLQHLAFQIASQFQAGHSRFQIRMDPPELGRIDVRMDVDAQGVVHARLAVDRAETLEMLRHDSRALERALQQAGLDQNKTNLEFSLRQNGSGSGQGGGEHQPSPEGGSGTHPTDDTLPLSTTQNAYQGLAAPGGLNLWV